MVSKTIKLPHANPAPVPAGEAGIKGPSGEEEPRLRLYLAHPVLSQERIRAWELKMEARYAGLELINPLYEKEDDFEEDLTGTKEWTRKESKRVVLACLELIDTTCGIIAIVDGQRSYGTIMEIVYAHLARKPVFVVASAGDIYHPWLQTHSILVFESLKALETGIFASANLKRRKSNDRKEKRKARKRRQNQQQKDQVSDKS